MTERDPLLVEREKTHGNFNETAHISQELKSIIQHHSPVDTEQMSSVQREALDMIAVKIARILSGNPCCREHWDDIIGYARLGAENCS